MIGGKAAELSNWDHTGPRTVEFYNIFCNWGETAASRKQPEKMGTVTAHKELTNIYFLEREKGPCLKGTLFVIR